MLKSLYLQNFRNYQQLEFKPDNDFLILTGANGTGKSNLLESIFYLGTGYSFRQVKDDHLVRFGADYFLIRGVVNNNGIDYQIEFCYNQEQRKKITKINNKNALPGSCASYLPVVIFSPLDLMLVKGGPAERRRFLDLVVGQLRPQHIKDLHNYNNILIQRNKQLRFENISDDQLLPSDQQLVTVGSMIWKRRVIVLSQLLGRSAEVFKSLSEGRELAGKYKSQICDLKKDDDLEQCKLLFSEAIKNTRPHDRRVKATTVGPHRDDFALYINQREGRLYASQGEQRLISLALKIGQYHLLSQQDYLEPLLLLDDVFSELDAQHKLFVLKGMKQGSQVIATTTTPFKDGVVGKKSLTDDIIMVYRKIF